MASPLDKMIDPAGAYSDPTEEIPPFGGRGAMPRPPLQIDPAAMPFAGSPIRAYHGSPAAFEKFDPRFIGGGEGAQAFGHGLYFAEHEPTAQSYKQSTSDLRNWTIHGQGFSTEVPSWVGKGMSIRTDPNADKSNMPIHHPGLDELIKDFRQRAKEMYSMRHWNAQGIQSIADALDAVKAGKARLAQPGHMYEVNLNAPVEHFIDWDKPLGEQSPNVRNAINNFYGLPSEGAQQTMTGQDLYRALAGTRDPREAAQMFQKAGIHGIRYLDQGSRQQGRGTYNYVVFPGSEHIIDILRRYGIMLGTTAGGALAGMAQENEKRKQR